MRDLALLIALNDAKQREHEREEAESRRLALTLPLGTPEHIVSRDPERPVLCPVCNARCKYTPRPATMNV